MCVVYPLPIYITYVRTCTYVHPSPPPYLVGRFPTEDGLVAPGMSCSYTVRFTPDSLADFQDELKVRTYVRTYICTYVRWLLL